ncbi:MAG: hypothetical protein IJO18_03145 [Alphaproteobacteria bacterium]|nr:hypothetical protein [Alphaproteobacteria bacterium]
MKKLLTLTAVGVILAVPAFAVQQCVFKPTMDNWEVCDNGTDGLSDDSGGWWIDCNGTRYRGIAMYSTADVGDVAETIDSGTPNTTTVYCYCKMIYPVLSKWIKFGGGGWATKTLAGDNYNTYVPARMIDDCAGWCVQYGDDGDGYASSLLNFLNNLEEN